MNYVKLFLVVLALPFFLIHMKIDHSKLEREKRKKMNHKGYKIYNTTLFPIPGPKREINLK